MISHKWDFGISIPLKLDGYPGAMMTMVVDADHLLPIMQGLFLPAQWMTGIVDRHGRIVARTHDQDRFVGTTIPSNLRFDTGRGPSVFEAMSLDGQLTLRSVTRTQYGDWEVAAIVSKSVIDAAIRGTKLGLTLAGLGLLGLASTLAGLFARWIIGPVQTLIDVAAKLKSAEVPLVPAAPVAEVNEVGLSLTAAEELARRQESHITFMMREISHRAKSLLAIIQSMATQTARTSVSIADFQARFSQRLQGLSASHDLLVNQTWEGVDLAALVKAQLRPFVDDAGGRLELSGPAIYLTPASAQALRLVLHELATNATKYGALSVPQGRIAIAWTVTPAADPRFHLIWTECDGPPVTPPLRQGFGATVYKRMLGQSLNASVHMAYEPGGIVWSFGTTLSSVGHRSNHDSVRPQAALPEDAR